MAGIISGIVAITTTFLGITGTVIGSVAASMLYQFFSHYFKEPLENMQTKKMEAQLVYAFPLIIILIIEVIYIISGYSNNWDIFLLLEQVTSGSLFRICGIGLIIMGAYPLIDSKYVKKSYGLVVLLAGIMVTFKGFMDINFPMDEFYILVDFFRQFDHIIAVTVVIILSYVLIRFIKDIYLSIMENKQKEKAIEEKYNVPLEPLDNVDEEDVLKIDEYGEPTHDDFSSSTNISSNYSGLTNFSENEYEVNTDDDNQD